MSKLSKWTRQAGFGVLTTLAVIIASVFTPRPALAMATAPPLGVAQSFGILGASAVTNTGPSIITNGNLGVSPGSAITGFPPGIVAPPGTTHTTDAVAAQARIDATIAYTALAAQTPFVDLTGQDLGTVGTLLPGIYRFSSSAQLTGTLTLDALNDPNSVFVFQIGSTLTTASNSSVVVINAPPNWCNKYWRVGSSATLGTGTAFVGNIIANQSITLNTGASLYGRALALNGAVTMYNNRITVPPCGAHLSLTKTVLPTLYVSVGDVLTYTLVATNDGSVTLTGVSISDPGLTIISSTPIQPATLLPSATLTVTGTRAIASGDLSSGSLTNTATASGTPPTGEAVSSTASVTALKAPSSPHLSLTKSVRPATFSNIGDVLTYTLVATNDGNATLTGVSIDDSGLLITGSTPAQGSSLTEGATMTVTGTRIVTQGDLNSGSLTNTATASGTPPTGAPVPATANVTATGTPPELKFIKTATLSKDADGDGAVSPGDTIKYTATITNVGGKPANGVTFSDTPDINTTLVTGSVTTTQGYISKGNFPGHKSVEVAIGTISASSSATVTFDVTINSPLWEHQIANQAIVSGANFSSVKSNIAVTQVKTSPPVHGPGISQWGITAMVVLLGGAMVWVIRRRQIRSEIH